MDVREFRAHVSVIQLLRRLLLVGHSKELKVTSVGDTVMLISMKSFDRLETDCETKHRLEAQRRDLGTRLLEAGLSCAVCCLYVCSSHTGGKQPHSSTTSAAQSNKSDC